MTTLKTTSKTKRKTKRDTLKPHRTVTITKVFLESHGACYRGMDFIDVLLPVTLSTNPDDNVELALHLATTDYSCSHTGYDGVSDARWFATTVEAHPLFELVTATVDGEVKT